MEHFLTQINSLIEIVLKLFFKELIDKNIKFIAASGNQFAKLKSIFGDREMFFISENGAVIYKGNQLYNYRSFDQYIFQKVVNYLNLNQKINNLIICGVKKCIYFKRNKRSI